MPSGRSVILSDYVGGEGVGSGGAGHAALDSYRALRAAGADVRVVAGFGAAPAIEATSFATLGGSDLREGTAAQKLLSIYNRSAGLALNRELAGEDPDTTLVILHQWTRYLSPAALGVADRFPTMIYMHDYFWACPNGVYFDYREGQPCDRRPMRAACLIADCDRQGRIQKLGRVARQAVRQMTTRASPERRLFLHLSEGAERTAAPLLAGERHAILYNPLPLSEASPGPAPPPLYDVGYFGRLEADKGVGTLIDAIARGNLSGLFIGQGSLEPALKGTTIDHRAWQPRNEMAAAMRSCAVVVLASLWHETWGLIVPEAMAAGVPVLVSERAGSAELVRRFGGGMTFDPASPGDLSAKLAVMLAQPSAPTVKRAELREFLSPGRHAARIMSLAESAFGLDLRAPVSTGDQRLQIMGQRTAGAGPCEGAAADTPGGDLR